MGHIALTRQDWMYGLYLFSAVVVFGNGIHWAIFRVLKRNQTETQRRSLGLRKFLAKPARGVFLLIGLRIVLPMIPRMPGLWLDRMEQVVEVLLVGGCRARPTLWGRAKCIPRCSSSAGC